ncbi:argininosuccinate lyase [Metabacillus fastidiosus]|uniref:Argininosuccinate lyase n=1 Tax=Metabacillus fastidiosus TaxID=1458 RepID=A0ABU6NSW0_9BACI|nr:argininosuccinate lyase [Metabacillus fastidiosus]MED4400230.1 argininosuccinate lyase [Metabacillus fastidiosus]
MFKDIKRRVILEDGSQFPSNIYKEIVLQPAYDEAKKNFLSSMLQIHIAHLKMLEEQGLVTYDEAVKISSAIKQLDLDYYRKEEYNPKFEDLFFRIEHELIERAGDIAGNLHIGRSRNDMGITIYRMTLRKKLLTLMNALLKLRTNLIAVAEEHIDTIMIGYTHTQQAQPTTLAHYLKAVIDQLDRDFKRMQDSYRTINRSAMGAAALTTTGFNISRERMRDLLAFDDIVENAWDAVASADYILEASTAVQLAALNLGRISQDFLLWATQEFNVFKLASPYVQVSSIMPQKRNPVSIEHMRSLLSSVAGDTDTVLKMAHNTPFGDIVDTEDDMQPYIWRAIDRLTGIYQLFGSLIVTMDVNKEKLLKHAENSFANVTELADTLVRSEQISFRQAHSIVSKCVKHLLSVGKESLEHLTWEIANKEALQVTKKPLTITPEDFYRALKPKYFVEIRTLPGGPSPNTMRNSLKTAKENEKKLTAWVEAKETTINQAEKQLNAFIEDW